MRKSEKEAELNFSPLRFDELIRWALENHIEIHLRLDTMGGHYRSDRYQLYAVTFTSEVYPIAKSCSLKAETPDLLLAECASQLEKIFYSLKMAPVRPRK
jgi:hypothetical protein